jgi:hypothetical protein
MTKVLQRRGLKSITRLAASLIDRSYAVEEFGEAGCPHPEGTRRLPEISIIVVVFAGKTGKYHNNK